MKLWDKATFRTLSQSIRYHAVKHSFGNDVWTYLRKASNFTKKGTKKVYRTGDDSVMYMKKSGEFLIERHGKIVTYGLN
jgi:hypothetical protein